MYFASFSKRHATNLSWEQRKLGEISNKVTKKNQDAVVDEVFTNSAEFGIISQRDFFEKDIANAENIDGYYVVEPDDFVYNPRISATAPFGPIKRNKLERTGAMSPLYYVFRPYDIDLSYLEWYFQTTCWHSFMRFNGNSGARSDRFAITDKIFNEMPISMPQDIVEQKLIGTFLTKLESLITLHQCKHNYTPIAFALQKTNNSTPSWEQRKLGDISDSYSGGTPTAGKAEYYGGNIPFIRSAEVNSDRTELFLTEEGLKNSSAKMVNKGDILYALYGATSGEVGLARLDGAINQAILDIKPHEDFDASFIMQWLRKSKASIIGTYLQGGQGNLSGAIVTSLMVDCPNYAEQQKIGGFFSELDDLITLHQR